MPINSFIQHLRIEKRYSDNTVIAYENDLQQFHEFISQSMTKDLLEVETQFIRTWIVDLNNRGVKARSINRKITCLRSFYNFLLAHDYIGSNPTTYIKLLKLDKPIPQFVDESQMTDLFSSEIPIDTYKEFLARLIVHILYDTGVRVSELVNLELANIDTYKMQIKVLGKRNKERVIPISQQLCDEINAFVILKIESLAVIENDQFLLHTLKGKKIYSKFVYRIINHYLSRVTTITKKSPHVLRHTFATHLLNKGAELNAIKDLLGHASLSATQIYTHNSIQQLKEVYNKAHPKAKN